MMGRYPGSVMGLFAFLAGCIDNSLGTVKEEAPVGDRVIEVDPPELDFGVVTGGTSVAKTFTVTSVGELPLAVSDIEMSGSTTFSLTWADAETTLEPGESTSAVITYTAVTAEDVAAATVVSNATEARVTVPLVGGGLVPMIQVDPGSVSLVSDGGETVSMDVHVQSVGSADLSLFEMVLVGGQFSAEADIPATLAPGADLWITVTYRPLDEGETVTGDLWLTTNTAAGSVVVPLLGQNGVPCMGLGEAWDRGVIDITTDSTGGVIVLDSGSPDTDLCIDQWYIVRSEGSQDAGVGDPNYDVGAPYPLGTLLVAPGDDLDYRYSDDNDAAWWCVEQTQYTQPYQSYTFTGARVPDPLLDRMLEGDQDAVWDWQNDNPVMVVGRDISFVEIPRGGGSASMSVRVVNMGSRDGSAEVWETVPPGMSAVDFSRDPVDSVVNGDGSTSYRFDIALGARTITGSYEDTIYEETEITYTLEVAGGVCGGRITGMPVTASWRDSQGEAQISTGNPLIVRCAS